MKAPLEEQKTVLLQPFGSLGHFKKKKLKINSKIGKHIDGILGTRSVIKAYIQYLSTYRNTEDQYLIIMP